MKIPALMIIFLTIPLSVFSATINFYVGDVTLTRGSAKIDIVPGSSIESGDEIITGRQSTIDIVYADGSKITILSSSRARFGSKNIKGSDDVALISGDLSGTFAKLKKGYRKAYTPTMVCSVRGTQFTLGVSGSGDSRVDLSEGKLNISNPFGNVDMKEDQKVEGAVGNSPAMGGDGPIGDWRSEQQKNFEADPAYKGLRYSEYMERFSERGKDAEKKAGVYNKKVRKAKSEKDLEKTADAIDSAEESAKDDLMLNETAGEAVSSIMKNFESSREDIYNQFKQVKEKSASVLDQQRKNYEAIAAVKEAHRKAYEKIKGDYKKGRDSFFDDVKKKSENPEQ